jgi:hypothetical protein
MRPRRLLVFALVARAVAPAPALAAPAVTASGNDGDPVPLSTASTVGLRNMDVAASVSVPRSDGAATYRTQVVDQSGTPASDASPCLDTAGSWSSDTGYRGNGTYSVIVREYPNPSCAGTPVRRVYRYAIDAGVSVTAPRGRMLTRAPNSSIAIAHAIGVSLNPGASAYEVRYALRGVAGPDGAISGPSTETFLDTATGLARFRFGKPGRYLVVARARRGEFSTPWSPAVDLHAIAPFDLERVGFPDARGPRYTLRGLVRERVARGTVAISWARGRKGGRFHRAGRAKIDAKGRFTKRLTLRQLGVYRLRCTYRGSALVAAGRVTEQIHIRRRLVSGQLNSTARPGSTAAPA